MKTVNGVKIVIGANGKPEFHIPSSMTGAAFTEWRRSNAAAIAYAVESMTVAVDSVTDTAVAVASPIKVVTIGKVLVTVSGGKLSFELPEGMTAKGLAQWKKRNASILSDLL